MKFLNTVFQSLHSPAFYQRTFREGQGMGFKYLLQLLALCWFGVALVLMILILQARSSTEEGNQLMLPIQILRKIGPQFPPAVIEKGKVQVMGEQPIILYDPDTGGPLMIIDTTGKINNLEGQQAQVLLTQSTLKIHYEGEDIFFDIPAELTMEITGGKLEEWADYLERTMPYAPFILLPFNVAFSLLANVGRWVLMAGIAFIALKSRAVNGTLSDCLRISAYALTASILLKSLIIGSGFQPFGSPEFVLFGIALLYLFFAVSAIAGSKK